MVFIKKNIHWIALIALGIGGYLLYKNQADKKAAAKKTQTPENKEGGFVGRTDKSNALGI